MRRRRPLVLPRARVAAITALPALVTLATLCVTRAAASNAADAVKGAPPILREADAYAASRESAPTCIHDCARG